MPLFWAGCKKKDRLASDTYTLAIVPAAATMVINIPKTFVVEGQAPGGNVDTDPEWTISPSSGADAVDPDFPLFGNTVTLTFDTPGFYVLTAHFNDKTASTQIRILATVPSGINSGEGSIYEDGGIPAGARIFSEGLTLTEITGSAPEGAKFMRAGKNNFDETKKVREN